MKIFLKKYFRFLSVALILIGCAHSSRHNQQVRIPAGDGDSAAKKAAKPGESDPDKNGKTSTSIEFDSISEFEKALNAIHEVNHHPELYKYLNSIFSDLLIIQDAKLAAKYGFNGRSQGLSESQLLYLYVLFPNFKKLLSEYVRLAHAGESASEFEDFKTKSQAAMEGEIEKLSEVKLRMLLLNDPSSSPILSIKGEPEAFKNHQIFVNHPILVEPAGGGERELIPAASLKAEVLKFIDGYEKDGELMLNVYEFNLKEVAEKLIANHQAKGGKMTVGIYKETSELYPENSEVWRLLKEYEAKVGPEKFRVTAVDSVGLNHQKIITRRGPGGKNGATMFLSGNLTQSCIGPEGDHLEAKGRPKQSIPNANSAVILESDLISAVTMFELRKTTVELYRGQDYAISGLKTFVGPIDPENPGLRSILQIGFSPTRGMVNDWYLGPLVESAKVRVLMAQFAMSSPRVLEALEKVLIASLSGESAKPIEMKFFGDTGFSMREWAVSLAMSGYMMDPETGKYIIDESSEIVKHLREKGLLEAFQKNFRVNPRKFGDFQLKVAGENGETIKITVKMHHKLLLVDNRVIIASSYNISEGAESNTEHLLLFQDGKIVRYGEAIVYTLGQEPGAISISERAFARNKNSRPDEIGDSPEVKREEEEGRKALKSRKGSRFEATMVTTVFDLENGLFQFLPEDSQSGGDKSFKERVKTALSDLAKARSKKAEGFYYLVSRLRNVVLAGGTYIDIPSNFEAADVYEGFVLIQKFLRKEFNITIFLPPLENFFAMDSILENRNATDADVTKFRTFLKKLNDLPESPRHGAVRAFEYWAGSLENYEAAVQLALKESVDLTNVRIVVGFIGNDATAERPHQVAMVENGKIRLANIADCEKIESWSVPWPQTIRKRMVEGESWKNTVKTEPVFKMTSDNLRAVRASRSSVRIKIDCASIFQSR